MKFIKYNRICLFLIFFFIETVNVLAKENSCENISEYTGFEISHNSNTYANPVIHGDFPDPSIIRVGDMYYAAGTSCDFGPNYPLYESTDLINWNQIGAVFSEPPAWTSDDFWAPELFYNNGTFYVYYTTKRKDNHIACIGVATTHDIHKGFSDQGIIIEWGEEAIDAFVFQDDDRKLYITWKAYGLTEGKEIEILASELSKDGLKLVGEPFSLTDHTKGWKGSGDEGPCLVKHNGYYYLFYSIGACCGKTCDYRVMVARSKNLRAGWEQYPDPILHGGDEWHCPGHGTLVTTPDNRFFYLYHAYSAIDFDFIGRQGMLDEVMWNKLTAWPYFKNGETPSVTSAVPFKNTMQKTNPLFFDDFSTNKNLAFWEWDINHPRPSTIVAGGEMRITTAHCGINFVGLRPKTGDYYLIAEVAPTDNLIGIGAYSNIKNSLALLVNKSELEILKVNNGKSEILAKVPVSQKVSLFLKYEVEDGRYYRFSWSDDGHNWVSVKFNENFIVDAFWLPQWGYAPRVGFITNGEVGCTAHYSSLKIKYKN